MNIYEDALRKRPSDWWLHYKYAGYLADDNVRKYQEAMNHYQFVIKTIPHDPNINVMLGVVLGKLGRFKESLDYNQMALIMNPTLARAYFISGLIYQ
jgi:tetratricopeptide (TPR) repeat protein